MYNRIVFYFHLTLLLAMLILCGVLLYEYRIFSYHAEELQSLQYEYQLYLMNMQKMINMSLLSADDGDMLDDQEENEELDQKKDNGLPLTLPKKAHIKSPVLKKKSQKLKRSRDFICSFPIEKGKFWLSSLFGPRKKMNRKWGYHYGIDMAALKGTPVKAAAAGKIIEAGYAAGYGKTIVIEHSKKYRTRYAHLDKIRIKKNQYVRPLQLIGNVGATGYIRKKSNDGSHLHFEVIQNKKQVNPLDYLV